MSTFLADPAVSVGLWLALKASLLLGLAGLAQLLLGSRASAATRHLVWTLAIVGLLLLPLLSLVLPPWAVATQTVAVETTDAYVATTPHEETAAIADPHITFAMTPASVPAARQTPRVSLAAGIAGLYLTGVLAMLSLLAMQSWRVRRLAQAAAIVNDEDWTHLLEDCARRIGVRRPVRLLRSYDRSMPVALGIHRPAIVIPSVAGTWSDDRRRAVLLHELAHVARHDCFTQLLAFAACTMYWFHPAAWWVAKRLQVERELACDDLVIASGTGARDYAGHLLEIAYSFGSRRAPALAVSMARSGQLERRLLAVVDAARNRTVPAVRSRVAGTLAAAAVVMPLASATTLGVPADARMDHPASIVEAQSADTTEQAQATSFEARVIESGLKLMRAAATTFGVAQDRLPGTWEIHPADREGFVHLRIVEVNSSSGNTVEIDRLEGLTAAQLAGPPGPVQFRLRRDAGTFTFEGVVRNGVAAGTFSFAPNTAFAGELAKRGFAAPSALEQYQMARHDVGYAFIDELTRQGYAKPQTSDLVRAGQHGVSATYVSEMGALGYKLGSLDPLITLRDHGVTPTYIRGLAALGYKSLAADEVRKARDHGITPEFVQGLRDAGYRDLSMAQLIEARDHGVSGEFAEGLRTAGQERMALEELIRVRDHGVSPEYAEGLKKLGHTLPLPELIRARDHGVDLEYAQRMRDAGYGSLAMASLINARDHGVDVEFVEDMASLGYATLPIESLIRVRDHGVTPAYIREVQGLGYDSLTIDDFVMLRDHGLTASRIRALNTRAGSRLPVELLKSLASGGAQ